MTGRTTAGPLSVEPRTIQAMRTCIGPDDAPHAPALPGGTHDHDSATAYPCRATLSAVYRVTACGCGITGDGTLQHPLTIEPCADHAAAMYHEAPR